MFTILSVWRTQPWFAEALHLLKDIPQLLPPKCLYQPQDPTRSHPLRKLRLAVSVRESFCRSGISERVTDVLCRAWDEKTLVTHGRHIKVWNEFCVGEEIDPFSPLLSKPLDHSFFLFHKGKLDGSGYSYSSLNAGRSAISEVAKIDSIPAAQHEVVSLYDISSKTPLKIT